MTGYRVFTAGKRGHTRLREALLCLVSLVFLALLAGCRGQAESSSPPAPSLTESARTAATRIAERGAKEWNYVALGDSITFEPASQGLIDRYAQMLEADLGVKVNLHNWTKASDDSSALLKRLQSDSDLRQALQDADVITFEIPWGVVNEPVQSFEGITLRACGGADNQDCLRQAFGTYETDTDAIVAEIVSLRSPTQALIRTMDTYQFLVKEAKGYGSFDVLNHYWREANAHVIDVAARYGIPAARVYDAFMGDRGADDPRDRGLVSDGFHPTVKGAVVMAGLFRDLGYAYAPPSP